MFDSAKVILFVETTKEFLVLRSLNRILAAPRTFGYTELTHVRKNPNIFGPSVLFFSIQTNEIQAFLCIRCSKIWFFTHLIVTLQAKVWIILYENKKGINVIDYALPAVDGTGW